MRRRLRAVGGAARAAGTRHRAAIAVLGGTIAVLPAAAVSTGTATWVDPTQTKHISNAGLQGGYDPGPLAMVSVDGSLPQTPIPEALPAFDSRTGPLGIPATALKAYQKAAEILNREQPGCNIDWALVASIGRIESNHARGGYVDGNGYTLEPILGPVLNGVGPVAAIPDTDDGEFDGDTVWDRAVGPTQFIPSTWWGYASDGNGDGESNPNNIYDAALATARYLCSGGMDLSNQEQLRAALFRYNNSDSYVNTVISWAQAYRIGVAPLPDSTVPVGAPSLPPLTTSGPPPVSPAQPPASTPGTTPPPQQALDVPPSSSESDSPGSESPGDSTSPDPSTPGEPTKPSDPGSPDPTEPTDPPTNEPEPTDPTDPPTDPPTDECETDEPGTTKPEDGQPEGEQDGTETPEDGTEDSTETDPPSDEPDDCQDDEDPKPGDDETPSPGGQESVEDTTNGEQPSSTESSTEESATRED